MATDRKGRKLHIGDVVHIPATITGIDKHDEFYNVALETVETMHPANHRTSLLLNAKQVELVAALGDSQTDIDVHKALSDSRIVKPPL